MAKKAPVVPKVEAAATPAPTPVDVISSIPLSVQLAPESLASLGAPPAGTAEPVTATPTAAAALGGTVGNPEGATPVAAPQAQETTTTTTTATAPVPVTVAKGDNLTLTPTTTAQEDVVTAGQRRVNLIWESVQGAISLGITAAVIYCQIQAIQSETLNNAFFFVVATYLQRSNHVKIGGVGSKPYEGR